MYIALSGATLKQAQMDIIAQNLANATTSGYKQDKISFQEFLLSSMNNRIETPDGRTMSNYGTVATDFLPGSVVHTGNPLDVALDGKGMLSLEDGQFTRRGDMRLDSEGYLVNQRGIKVLGRSGPIRINETGAIEISGQGDVSVVNGSTSSLIDKLRIVEFPDTSVLRKSGEGAFTAGQSGVESGGSVRQGYLEKSNVDVVNEMVRMITALREFEAYQKAIQSFDESIGRVLSDMPKI